MLIEQQETINPASNKKNIYFLLIAIIIYVLCAFHSAGYYHVDEYYQILDFASYKAGNPLISPKALMWEYWAHVRPSLQVYIAYITINGAALIGIRDPFVIATLLRICSSLLCLFCLAFMYRVFNKELISPYAKTAYLIICTTLWFMPYLSARFSSETWSGAFFFIALCYLMAKGESPKVGRYFIAGLLLGLAFNFRFQAGFFIFGLFAWLIFLNNGYRKAGTYIMALGIIIVLLIGIMLDHWLYNVWTFSAFQYFKANIIENKAAEYGTMPWYGYFVLLFNKSGPFALLIISAMFYIWIKRPRHILSWVSLPFVLAHLLIGHKELRFLFPLFFMIPVAIVFLIEDKSFAFLKRKWTIVVFMALNTPLLLFWLFAPSAVPVKAIDEAYHLNSPEKVRIYYTHSNPYCLAPGYRFSFYMMPLKEAYNIEKIDNAKELINKDFKQVILYSNKRGLDNKDSMPGIECKLIWQTLPRFITNINLFHWVDRTQMDCIYLCTRKQVTNSQ